MKRTLRTKKRKLSKAKTKMQPDPYTSANATYLKLFGNPFEASMFGKVIALLEEYPELRSKKYKGADTILIDCVLENLAKKYHQGRTPKPPSLSKNADDEVVFIVMESYFHTETSKRKEISLIHRQAMGAENVIGSYIEYYIASVLESAGWVWCAGSVVDKVDFFKPIKGNRPVLVQVKSRDNTENSSSMTVRDGTEILKWFRLESKSGKTCWASFPDREASKLLSEKSFRETTRDLLEGL